MNLAIETQDLGKRYRDVKAVEHLSLRVAEGEIYAFLGLNGAGKTTTTRELRQLSNVAKSYLNDYGERDLLMKIKQNFSVSAGKLIEAEWLLLD